MGLWQWIQLVAAFPLVVVPFVAQARELLHPPMNTPSLGTFGIVMAAAFYFLIASPMNATILGLRAHWPWYATLGLALAATATGVVGSYVLLYRMATKGGTARTLAGGAGLAILFFVNLLLPRLVPAE